MPRARFRIQTIMIVIAAFAVLLVLLKSLTQPFFENMVVFAAAVIVLAAATFALLLVVIASLIAAIVDVFAFAVYLWRGRTTATIHAHGQFSNRNAGTEPKRPRECRLKRGGRIKTGVTERHDQSLI